MESMTPRHPSVVVLTGAGISRESGLATFRDPDGTWARVRVEDVATPGAFARDPGRVHEFYNARRASRRPPPAPVPRSRPGRGTWRGPIRG